MLSQSLLLILSAACAHASHDGRAVFGQMTGSWKEQSLLGGIGPAAPAHEFSKRAASPYALVKGPSLGVGAMQVTVTGINSVLVIDKAENNPAKTPNGKPAYVQWKNLVTGKSKQLTSLTNTFCAVGSWLGNGTMVSFGGNPIVRQAQYGDENGMQGIRLFDSCNDKSCTISEFPQTVRLAVPRWYPGASRLKDGSILIAGGTAQGAFNNELKYDQSSYEFFPSKSINNGMPVFSPFLRSALNSNLFPVQYLLPSGLVFIGANTKACLYNWAKNIETLLPDRPGGVIMTYPFNAATALLPLTIANNWTPEVVLCGGIVINDKQSAKKMSSQMPTSKACHRMVLTTAAIKKGWVIEDDLPEGRIMGSMVLLPNGLAVIVNGAGTGAAGYANVPDVVGQSNADNPTYRSIEYNPNAAKGKRMNVNMPISKIARMYHSAAILMPTGQVFIAGSNPNADVTTKTYATEYRTEFLNPPYMSAARPVIKSLPAKMPYGAAFTMAITLPKGAVLSKVTCVLIDSGYTTHSVQYDQKLIELVVTKISATSITVTGPLNGAYIAPGRVYIYVLADGIPSVGAAVLVGDGSNPPFSAAANANMLKSTMDPF